MTTYTPAQAREIADKPAYSSHATIAAALRSLADQVEALEAQLSAVGAGGVQRLKADKAYTVAEVDALRSVCKLLVFRGTLDPAPGTTYYHPHPGILLPMVEEMMRTYIAAGLTAADLRAEHRASSAATGDTK